MTIAAGFNCADGVVLAADTKESYGESHTYVDKITTVDEEHCKAAIASSGNGDLLDFITSHVEDLLKSESVTTSMAFEMRLQALMGTLYQSNAIKAYPIEKPDELYTQFLIAAKHRTEESPALFLVKSTLVTRVKDFGTVIGCGPMTEMARELGLPSAPALEKACTAAICIIHEAKRRYSDVGGRTNIVTIANNGEMTFGAAAFQAQQEALLDSLRGIQNALMIGVLDPLISKESFNNLIRHTVEQARELHKEAVFVRKHARQEFRRRPHKKVMRSTRKKSKRVQ